MATSLDKVIITGVSGFLGRHLAKACAERGLYVIGTSRQNEIYVPPGVDEVVSADNLCSFDWAPLLAKSKPRAIFHLATPASVAGSLADPLADFQAVVPGVVNLIIAVGKYTPDTHLVLFSSAAVYGNPVRLPIREEDECCPISPYGVNKFVAEQACRGYSVSNKTKVSCLRIFSAFGEGLRRQIFFDIFAKINAAREVGAKSISMFGDGSETRDFVHVDDVCRAALLVAALDRPAGFEAYNVAAGIQTKIADATQHLIDFLDAGVAVEFNKEVRAGDPRYWHADISKIRELGFTPEVDFEAGLARYARWLLNAV